MAKATRNDPVIPPPPPPANGVTLVLTEDETVALTAIMGHVGGHPRNSHRGYIDAICDALKDAGYPWTSYNTYTSGSLHFDR
jgi:hypothetical protein